MSPLGDDSNLGNLKVEPVKEYDDDKSVKEMDGNSNVTPATTKIEHKRATVSIDVTKALMLLGFSSWSGLEKGK